RCGGMVRSLHRGRRCRHGIRAGGQGSPAPSGSRTIAPSMYRTETVLRRQLRVRYPAGQGRLVLRTELDWDRDLEAESVSEDGETSTFALAAARPFLYFKPCLRAADGGTRWAVGPDLLVLMTT